MRRHGEALEQLNTQVLFLSFVGGFWAEGWLKETGLPWPLLIDEEREVYRAYGLARSVLRVWRPRVLWDYVKIVARRRPLPRIWGDPNQLGGDFIVDAGGILRWAYRGRAHDDRPAVETILQVLERVANRAE